jgi:hypothetical protein
MQWLWTWSGKCFGYRDEENLWTYNGRHVGQFAGDEVYGADGFYLGELRNGTRLITDQSKRNARNSPFMRRRPRGGYAAYVGYPSYAMFAGYEDFPAPDTLG